MLLLQSLIRGIRGDVWESFKLSNAIRNEGSIISGAKMMKKGRQLMSHLKRSLLTEVQSDLILLLCLLSRITDVAFLKNGREDPAPLDYWDGLLKYSLHSDAHFIDTCFVTVFWNLACNVSEMYLYPNLSLGDFPTCNWNIYRGSG